MADLGTGLIWFVAFLLSTTVHEAMHAWVAWRGGDPTAYHGGQVSLSPVPHIRREPIGMLVVPLLTALTQGWAMGWASAPYDPNWAARHPRRAAIMAAAGPAGNFLLALGAFALLKAGLIAGFFVARGLVVNPRVDEYDGTTAVTRSEGLDVEEIEFLRWKAERWMKARHMPRAFAHDPVWVARNAPRLFAHTFRGSTWRSLMGLEDERTAFGRYRSIRAKEREYLDWPDPLPADLSRTA